MLQVEEIQACIAGYYRCVVSNSAGSEASRYASLTVGKHVCPISANLKKFLETLFLLHPVPKVRDLNNALQKVIDWMSFGLNLGFEVEELQIIEGNYPKDLKRCRLEMLTEWRKKVTPTWSAVVQALMVIGNKRLAFELAQKHGWLQY